MSRAGTEFLRSSEWQKGATAGLARLGRATDVRRLSVLRLDRREGGAYHATLVLEWTGEGIEPVLGDPLLRDVPAEEAGMSRWVERFEKDRPVCGPVAGLPESERSLLRAQNIKSVAAVPVHVRDELRGMMVYDDCETEREWATTEVEALRAADRSAGASSSGPGPCAPMARACPHTAGASTAASMWSWPRRTRAWASILADGG